MNVHYTLSLQGGGNAWYSGLNITDITLPLQRKKYNI